eukprot:snap_masked-scaffold_6-processed-gene-11.51-mRNA-1 protein AED:1.00 eAED:1.00 QI:0/-1/0/0/-1/1/1/0/130
MPSFGMLSNARSLAGLTNAMLFQEQPILSEDTRDLMLSDVIKKYDFIFGFDVAFDKGGFCVFGESDFAKHAPSLHGFRGWGESGGSMIIFHPEKKLVFSYTPSYRPFLSMGGFFDKRCLSILEEFFIVNK